MFHPPTKGRNKMKKGMKKHSFGTKKRGGENQHNMLRARGAGQYAKHIEKKLSICYE